ncbi:HHAT-1 protein [Aphelenchoides avenae]|nr:HHAT-1 protein [Aphelenchus avenae]
MTFCPAAKTGDEEIASKKQDLRRRRSPIFEYPALPEMKLCYAVVFCAMIYAWYCVYSASTKWQFKIGHAASITRLPFIGPRFKDETNWEWFYWPKFAMSYIPYLVGHCALFNFSERYLPPVASVVLTITYSLISSAILFTPKLLAYSVLQGIFLFVCTYWLRHQMTVWIASVPILYVVMNHTFVVDSNAFLVLLFVSYTLLSYISFCLELVKGRTRPQDDTAPKMFLRMFFYAFYQPYLVSIIVIYPEFEKQMVERGTRARNWRSIGMFAARVAFWWLVAEAALHFLYFEAILADAKFAAQLPKNEFVTLGMALGTFFHLKYVVIFGLPSVFARIDNMVPPDGPICISRVALYSKIWRAFDRGLYAFFKEYIFIPICAPTFSTTRKIFGVLVSYGFVLLWHGMHHHNVVWIILNIVELFLEYGSKGIYTVPTVRTWRERHLSDVNFRRVLGWLQIVPFAFGLYSNFYFLGGSEVGRLFVDRIFWEETVPVRWPFLLLIFLGYFYMQVAMESDRRAALKQDATNRNEEGREENKSVPSRRKEKSG